uniref:Uncharacterized protein n=1 Tax=Lotus japonicus TaxID=34305 RepID=I3T8G1_LOTJA|nr:unknown [Lotus japonicus]
MHFLRSGRTSKKNPNHQRMVQSMRQQAMSGCKMETVQLQSHSGQSAMCFPCCKVIQPPPGIK